MPQYYEKRPKLNLKKHKTIAGGLLLLSGLAIFMYFLFPILSYQLFLGDFIQSSIETPIPHDMVADNGNDVGSLITQGINSLTHDYTDARNWYPQISSNINAVAAIQDKTKVDSYFISIPKLKIDAAQVSTTDYDLDHHLVQYLGTALPGQNGTAVIFGHSTIPAWFDPKNYKTIFATALGLKVGDEISAIVGGSTYKYKIFSIVITSPEDVNILSQGYDRSYITLVTCTPPGTTWKRLIIRAAMEDLPQQT